jgi:hypothetical protein
MARCPVVRLAGSPVSGFRLAEPSGSVPPRFPCLIQTAVRIFDSAEPSFWLSRSNLPSFRVAELSAPRRSPDYRCPPCRSRRFAEPSGFRVALVAEPSGRAGSVGCRCPPCRAVRVALVAGSEPVRSRRGPGHQVLPVSARRALPVRSLDVSPSCPRCRVSASPWSPILAELCASPVRFRRLGVAEPCRFRASDPRRAVRASASPFRRAVRVRLPRCPGRRAVRVPRLTASHHRVLVLPC